MKHLPIALCLALGAQLAAAAPAVLAEHTFNFYNWDGTVGGSQIGYSSNPSYGFTEVAQAFQANGTGQITSLTLGLGNSSVPGVETGAMVISIRTSIYGGTLWSTTVASDDPSQVGWVTFDLTDADLFRSPQREALYIHIAAADPNSRAVIPIGGIPQINHTDLYVNYNGVWDIDGGGGFGSRMTSRLAFRVEAAEGWIQAIPEPGSVALTTLALALAAGAQLSARRRPART